MKNESGMPRPSKPTRPIKAVTVTAVLTFVATALGQHMIGRIADGAAEPFIPDLGIEVTTQVNFDGAALVPTAATIPEGWLPQSAELVNRWAVNNGGGAANYANIGITVWGNLDRPVILSGIRAANVRCQDAPAWTYIHGWGGGTVVERELSIALDSGVGDAVPVESIGPGEEFDFPLQVSKSDVEVFSLSLSVDRADCTYELELGYQDGGAVKYMNLGTGPLRVISSSRAAMHYTWEPEDPEDGPRVRLERCPAPCS